jgi:hypothetical protein
VRRGILRQPGTRRGEPPALVGSIRALAGPRWESNLLRFLELSGLGRVLANGMDEEKDMAARMDSWVVWEHRDREPDWYREETIGRRVGSWDREGTAFV